MATVKTTSPFIPMGDNAATEDPPKGKSPSESPASTTTAQSSDPSPCGPASAQVHPSAPPSASRVLGNGGQASARRSSIRPAPASFKPTLRDSSKLPPPMVIHSGDADQSAPVWGDPDVVNHPSQVRTDAPLRPEPFKLAEDLHQTTLPLELPFAAALPSDRGNNETEIAPPSDSSDAVTQTKLEPPTAASIHPPDVAAEPDRRPVAAVESAAGEQKSSNHRGRLLPMAAAVILLGLGVAVYAGRRGTSAGADIERTTVAASDTKPVASVDAEPAPNPSAAAEIPEAPTSPVPAPSSSTSTVVPPNEAPEANGADKRAADVVRVLVKLTPPDAKLTYRGVAVSGPPFYVEVPKGKKLYLEASRKGYVTRKVTVDANKPETMVGLVEPRKK